MNSRERVFAALDFKSPDRVPIQVHPSAGGLFEHGQKLLDLIKACPNDFDDLGWVALPDPPARDFAADGSYHRVKVDDWGVTWDYRIFGIWGHPYNEPLADISRLDSYTLPPVPPMSGPDFDRSKADAARQKEKYICVRWGGMLWEQMHFLRPYEDCMVDIMDDTPQINRVADMITGHMESHILHHLAAGADAIAFADDFGTQQAPIFPPAIWRQFFKPRYERLCRHIRNAGKKIFFHSCGQIAPLLDDLAELGVNAVWPQLPLYDHRELARRCRSLGMAVQLHPDRGDLMQRATPADVRAYLHHLLEDFNTPAGGSWLYLEIDPGFKWDNIKTLFDFAMELADSR